MWGGLAVVVLLFTATTPAHTALCKVRDVLYVHESSQPYWAVKVLFHFHLHFTREVELQ